MKNNYLIIIIALAFMYACSNTSPSAVDKALHVYGNCEKCKARIEKASKLNGLTKANWNVDSKLLSCNIDTAIISVDAVLKAIAAAGHDNEGYPANDYAYDKLPVCCQYERIEH